MNKQLSNLVNLSCLRTLKLEHLHDLTDLSSLIVDGSALKHTLTALSIQYCSQLTNIDQLQELYNLQTLELIKNSRHLKDLKVCVCVYVCMRVCVYVCMHVCILKHICNLKLFQLSLFFFCWGFLSRITQLEQCVSSSFVFVNRKTQRTVKALIEI